MKYVSLAVLAAVMSIASTAASARVVMMPSVSRTCGRADSWGKVSVCVGRFGKLRVVRELEGVKLISVDGERFSVSGLYIYVQKDQGWRLAGTYNSGGDLQLFSFERVTLAKHHGYRIELGVVEKMSLDPDHAGDLVPGDLVQQKVTVLCSGASSTCTAITTSCDVFIDGASRESFRGTLTYNGDEVLIAGDRSRDSTFGYCTVPEQIALGFDDGSD